MVSPLRIAREAASTPGSGKGKFLNEYLTWRGLSYAHFYHFPMLATGATLAQIPSWARDTLKAHAGDARSPSVSRESMLRARSGNKAWDALQAYLIETGELHNNARMGWGKAIAKWSDSPEAAVNNLIELNNLFALDGHAPPSYGGLFGSLGLFEGPGKGGEGPVLGKINYKPPKAKYSSVCSQIPELFKLLQESKQKLGASHQSTPARRSVLFEPPSRKAAPPPEEVPSRKPEAVTEVAGRKRRWGGGELRWVAKQQIDSIDLTEE
eukprot:TRINITY_DN17968_c0_g1_i2.p1 TRINITY_DN17968_c0_g1~~TRINITY_DN17968_c0_g1_i2.p1  ORF type:complete len:267 (-),score=31.98 TRINITY_DN17968_c0_g1_i2:359-1159(-)